jgi:PAS domain S-box-containing protein
VPASVAPLKIAMAHAPLESVPSAAADRAGVQAEPGEVGVRAFVERVAAARSAEVPDDAEGSRVRPISRGAAPALLGSDLDDGQLPLRAIADCLPVLVSYVDNERRYRFVNRAYEAWFGIASRDIVGKHIRDVLGEQAFDALAEHIDTALGGVSVSIQLRVPYRHGGERFIDATYVPHVGADGSVRGFAALITDISELKRVELVRAAEAERTERLMKVTAAIAEAVDAEQVLQAVVDRMASVLGATSVALWLVSPDGARLSLVRSVGDGVSLWRAFDSASLEPAGSSLSGSSPAVDAVRRAAPLWLSSQSELGREYPHLAALAAAGGASSIACLPLIAQCVPRGCIAFSFGDARILEAPEQDFLSLVARYAGQALERLRLLEAERAVAVAAGQLYEANEQGRVRAEILYELAARVIRAKSPEEVFEAALDGIERALGASRCSILAYDATGVMRFKAWRGLSEPYRAAVEGHSPWERSVQNPEPLVVPDVLADVGLRPYAGLFQTEQIGALGFIPLVSEGRLIGKFMVYYPAPRALSAPELDMARAIANHVAAAMGRFSALRELEQTVRFNEIFTGMLGHDLRNPLAAIMTAAQIAERRSSDAQLVRPISRILNSGARMAKMIDHLLDFTRVRVGAGIPIDPRAADVHQIVRQAMDEIADAHPGTRLTLEQVGDRRDVAWDSDRMLQVLSNLLANAVHHGAPENGVSVRIDCSNADRVSVSIHNMGLVPADVLPRLFEPMAGGDRRRSNSRGIGLGLYISREIAKAHAGSIAVDTSLEAGTKFTVHMPRVAWQG